MKRIEGYGRYDDDPEHVGCPRATTDMTPCVARDGSTGQDDDGLCVGCGSKAADLLAALVRAATCLPMRPQHLSKGSSDHDEA